jgi:hypothetical protein
MAAVAAISFCKAAALMVISFGKAAALIKPRVASPAALSHICLVGMAIQQLLQSRLPGFASFLHGSRRLLRHCAAPPPAFRRTDTWM